MRQLGEGQLKIAAMCTNIHLPSEISLKPALKIAVIASSAILIYGSIPNINKGTGGLFLPCLITL